MTIKLKRADIVILASSHNPSIISPQWLKDNSLITEDPINFMHTLDFSLFESESFLLVVDRQRLQITAKKQDEESLRTLADFCSKYIKLLAHIPYQAFGLNFIWSIENGKEGRPKIEIRIDKSNFAPVFEGHEVNYGGIIYARKEPYLLKLVIEPEGENALMNNFNYHHELKGVSVEDMIAIIDSFLTRYNDSLRIVKSLYKREEE